MEQIQMSLLKAKMKADLHYILLFIGVIKSPLKTDEKNANFWFSVNLISGRENIVRLLLQNNETDVNDPDEEGRTILYWAAWDGNFMVHLTINSIDRLK